MPQIESLRPEDWTAAMTLALARVPDSERAQRVEQCLDLLAAGTIDPRGVWIARERQCIVGMQICVPLAGKACSFWLPVAEPDAADSLVQAALAWSRSLGCKIAQASAHADEMPHAEPLLRNGFQHITSLQQLEHYLTPPRHENAGDLRFENYRASNAAEFAATLERTYAGTLDCPELNGIRGIDEIMAGHRGQGKYNPDYWWLARCGSSTAGVVILVELPDGLTWELAYLGVTPAFRRRGLARCIMAHALRVLGELPATRLTVAVDARNLPALRLYRTLGFADTDASEVLLYFFR